MKVRCYADEEITEMDEYSVRLLGQIHDNHGISVEIDRIDSHHGAITDSHREAHHSTPEEVYKRDLTPNVDLNEALNQTPSEAFKRYGKLNIAGNVAIVDEEETVQWTSALPKYADGYDTRAESQTAMDFLESMAVSPSIRICVKYQSLLDGHESFCPNCGYEPT